MDWAIAASPIVVSAISYMTHWLSRPTHALRWIILPPQSMLEVADEISGRLSTTFDGQTVRGLTKFTFILHNSGREPIDNQMIFQPITWSAPGRILSARIVASLPPVNLSIKHSDRKMELSWHLFNQRCKALIEVICESKVSEDSEGVSVREIEGQIRNVPEIKAKHLRPFDEMEARRRIRKDRARVPRVLKFLASEHFILYLLRYRPYVVTASILIYACVVIFYFAVYFFADSTMDPLPHWAIILAAASFSIFFFIGVAYFVRNPYGAILRLQSR